MCFLACAWVCVCACLWLRASLGVQAFVFVCARESNILLPVFPVFTALSSEDFLSHSTFTKTRMLADLYLGDFSKLKKTAVKSFPRHF